jgi:hypothetical protein
MCCFTECKYYSLSLFPGAKSVTPEQNIALSIQVFRGVKLCCWVVVADILKERSACF